MSKLAEEIVEKIIEKMAEQPDLTATDICDNCRIEQYAKEMEELEQIVDTAIHAHMFGWPCPVGEIEVSIEEEEEENIEDELGTLSAVAQLKERIKKDPEARLKLKSLMEECGIDTTSIELVN